MKKLFLSFCVLSGTSYLLGPSLIGLMLLISGCARTIEAKKLMVISVGMNKAQVIKKIGEPTVLRSSRTNNSGQLEETYEYEVDKRGFFEVVTPSSIDTYWLYFVDGALVRFHKAGDFDSSKPTHIFQKLDTDKDIKS